MFEPGKRPKAALSAQTWSMEVSEKSSENSTRSVFLMGDKILVTCASGKAGLECCRALVDAGFDVYGTSRTSTGGKKISAVGVYGTSRARWPCVSPLGPPR
jgi:rhodanese-related sulfurtransferase